MYRRTRHPHVWQVDNYPAPSREVQGRHTIRWPSEATGLATKAVTGRPVSPAHVAADGTGLTTVGRVHGEDGHTGRLGFVPQKDTKLVESPGAEALSLGPRDLAKQSLGQAELQIRPRFSIFSIKANRCIAILIQPPRKQDGRAASGMDTPRSASASRLERNTCHRSDDLARLLNENKRTGVKGRREPIITKRHRHTAITIPHTPPEVWVSDQVIWTTASQGLCGYDSPERQPLGEFNACDRPLGIAIASRCMTTSIGYPPRYIADADNCVCLAGAIHILHSEHHCGLPPAANCTIRQQQTEQPPLICRQISGGCSVCC